MKILSSFTSDNQS